jgi:hypothetical protein
MDIFVGYGKKAKSIGMNYGSIKAGLFKMKTRKVSLPFTKLKLD